ncbi:MAG: alanine--tRNA ligase [bacterium]
MLASEIRRKYLDFFTTHGHALIPAAPLVPPDDPTTLFNSSGMQQLVPYLKGQPHPMGKRLVNAQPCFRADDIEEVGDNRHTTIFEMLGNWSLGDYFKKEQLSWVWEFFTKELTLDPNKLHVTLFKGDAFAPQDTESYQIWQSLGVSKDHLHYYPDNWWSRAGDPNKMPVGEIGGPDSEIFYDFGPSHKFHENSPWKNEDCHVNCDCGRYLEIGNSVFMQYEKTTSGMKPLPAQNVDFGGGFERIVAVVQNTPDIFTTDIFSPLIKSIEKSSGKSYEGDLQAPMRVIADHLRAAVFMLSQGIIPSNKLQGYLLRRLLRRAAVRGRALGGDIKTIFSESIPVVIKFYSEAGYLSQEVEKNISSLVIEELDRFNQVLTRGLKEIEKYGNNIDEQLAFNLYQSFGFPFEITRELTAEKGVILDPEKFNLLIKSHQASSRSSSTDIFKGGLADHSEITTKYHTTTHLLHQALRDILGDSVSQAGSNISPERLRFDYTYSGKPTQSEIKRIELLVNDKITADLPVTQTIEDKEQAIKSGARAFFREKYPDKVSVYTIGKPGEPWYSKELCGGPHVARTGLIGKISILKEESLGQGTRRIYCELV